MTYTHVIIYQATNYGCLYNISKYKFMYCTLKPTLYCMYVWNARQISLPKGGQQAMTSK